MDDVRFVYTPEQSDAVRHGLEILVEGDEKLYLTLMSFALNQPLQRMYVALTPAEMRVVARMLEDAADHFEAGMGSGEKSSDHTGSDGF